jgi:hypothetical protein
MKKIALFATVAASALLASCTLTNDQQAAAARAYDKICTAEPPLYAAFVNAAMAKGSSEKTLKRAESVHVTIATMCETRPADPVTALVTLSAAYVQIVQINATVK